MRDHAGSWEMHGELLQIQHGVELQAWPTSRERPRSGVGPRSASTEKGFQEQFLDMGFNSHLPTVGD